MKTPFDIEAAFESYVKNCFPFGNVGKIQLEEMKRVFHAGIHATVHHIASLGEPEWTEDEAMKEIQRIADETMAFANRVRRTQQNQ